MKTLKLLFLIMISLAFGLYTFFLFMFRFDTAGEFQLAVRLDVIFGLLFGILFFLWFHRFFSQRVGRLAFVIYPLVASGYALFFLYWHFHEAILRGGDPLRMLLYRG